MSVNGDPRAIYTLVDVAFFKSIATALEEYSIDHSMTYPKALTDLVPKYLLAVPIVPGSATGAHYGYSAPPPNSLMGNYVITDADALVDAQYIQGVQIPRGVGGQPCAPGQCLHLSFAQKIGVVGAP